MNKGKLRHERFHAAVFGLLNIFYKFKRLGSLPNSVNLCKMKNVLWAGVFALTNSFVIFILNLANAVKRITFEQQPQKPTKTTKISKGKRKQS